MAVDRIIGVDFGTSTSVIRIKRYDQGKPVGDVLETKEVVFGGKGAMVPTLMMQKDDDASVCYFGYEAQQKKKNYTNFHGFKMDLESGDPARQVLAKRLTEVFCGYLAKQYRSQSEGGHLGSPDDKEHTIISYPVKWNEQTKAFMLETAKKAGFPNVTGMDEAQAAIRAVAIMSGDHLQKNGLLKDGEASNILLIDMGAGTTDLVLARHIPGENGNTQILNVWPRSGDIQFGGREIDELLQNFFREKLDEEDAEIVFSRIGPDKFKSWKEETVSPALRNQESVRDFEVLDSCMEMMGIELGDYCLDRAAFENCLSGYLKQFPELVNGCLQDVGMNGGDVDLVIITGGHSQWYFVNDMLFGKMPQFGNLDLPKIRENPARIIPISRPQETVALGLAYSGIRVHEAESAVTELADSKIMADKTPEPAKDERKQSENGNKESFVMPYNPNPTLKSFVITQGTVVVGTVRSGSVEVGSRVYICGGPWQVKFAQVKKIVFRANNKNTSRAQAGDYVAILLGGVSLEEVKQGAYLADKPDDVRAEPYRAEEEPKGNAVQELLEKFKTAGTITYRISRERSIAGAAEKLREFFVGKKFEAQCMEEDGVFLVQARNKPGVIGVLAGASKSVDITMIPTGIDQVSIKVSGGKWLDKGAGMAASSFISFITPIPLVVYGTNAVLQGKLIEDAKDILKKYFES